MWTASTFLGTLLLLRQAEHAPPPPSYVARVEAMFNYGAMVVDQRGYGPRNGDADLGKAGWSSDAYEYFKREDWLYVATTVCYRTTPV